MDRLKDGVRQEFLWTMMFANGIMICNDSRQKVEETLERWRYALEKRQMKVRISKTDYMGANERESGGKVSVQRR